MAQIIEAIYTNGTLKLIGSLPLADQQRVRLTVEPLDPAANQREAAIARFKAGVAKMDFHLKGPLPSRDELHDRS